MCNNDNCEKKTEDLKFFLDGYIDEAADDTVTIPREEYDELIAESTILRVVEKMVESDAFSSYSLGEYLKAILSIGKPEPQPDPVSDIPSAPGPDEEDAE